jgi:hypothetical protein
MTTMAVTKVIRYTTKVECADANDSLIRCVFAELAEEQPEGLRYAAFRLEDGVSFLHVATIEGEVNPLHASTAFAEFQSDLHNRIDEGPMAADASIVGSYRTFTD